MDFSSFRARSRTVRITALSAAAVTIAGLGVAVGQMAGADPAISCSPVKIVAVPGTWENSQDANQMLKGVTNRIEQRFGPKVSSYFVTYDADAFKNGTAYEDSEKSGVDAENNAMKQIAASCPGTKIVSLGYSQGADVNGDVAAAIGAGKGAIPADGYVAGGNLADPQQGTKGAVNLGVNQPGTQGLLGPRKAGYGAVSGRMATVCLKGDMYCATPNNDHLIRALGAVGGNIGVDHVLTSAERDLAKGPRKQKYTKPEDLTNLPPTARKLAKFAHGGNIKGVTQTARQLNNLVGPAEAVAGLATNPAVISALLATPVGSQTHTAGMVLQKMSQLDISAIGNDAHRAINAASRHNLDALDSVAVDLTQKIGPVAGLSKSDAAKTAIVMQALSPAALFTQANNVAGLTKINYKAMLRAANNLPKAASKGNTKAAFRALNTLEAQLTPAAKIANKVDFRSLGAALALSKDPKVRAAGDALVILDRVNWARILRDVRAIQNKMATVNPKSLPKLNPRNPVRSLNNFFGVNVLGIVGPATDLGQHGLDVLGLKLPEGSLKQLVNSSLNPAEVARESMDAAVFYGTRVHEKYGQQSVNGTGEPATVTMANWLAGPISAA